MRGERCGVGLVPSKNRRWSGNGNGYQDGEVVVMTWGMEVYFFYLRLCKSLLKGIALALLFFMDGRVDKAVALHI